MSVRQIYKSGVQGEVCVGNLHLGVISIYMTFKAMYNLNLTKWIDFSKGSIWRKKENGPWDTPVFRYQVVEENYPKKTKKEQLER